MLKDPIDLIHGLEDTCISISQHLDKAPCKGLLPASAEAEARKNLDTAAQCLQRCAEVREVVSVPAQARAIVRGCAWHQHCVKSWVY